MAVGAEDAPLKDSRDQEENPEQEKPRDPMDRLNMNKPATGGLFKEVNELRNVNRGPETDESDKFSDTFFGKLAANKKFEGLTFLFIGVNSLYIGIDADYSARTGKPDDLWDADTPIGFKIMENIFCIYFTAELIIRFIGYKKKSSCVTDGWFVFDGILVLFMVLETWFFPIIGVNGALAQFSVLRLLRLLRISRMARLMKKVPELMIIIKGLIASFRSVGCTAILQVLILYVWSILFVSEYHEEEDSMEGIEGYFGTMGKSMFSLFIYGTVLDDVTACTDAIRETGKMGMLALFIVFILISSFTILNMLIGILCEVVSATAESEKTKAAETCVKEAITTLFHKLDVDGSGNVTEDEFMMMREDQTVRGALEEMDIYESHFNRYCEILFHGHMDADPDSEQAKEKPTISFDTLITMILRLSPGNHINALDFSLLQASIDRTQEHLRERILKCQELSTQCRTGKAPPPRQEADEEEEMRKAAKGDAPPSAPSAGTDLRGTASSAAQPSAAKEYTLDMFVRTSSHQIIEELERRLGVSALEGGKTLSLSPSQPQKDRPVNDSQEAFHSLGVPED